MMVSVHGNFEGIWSFVLEGHGELCRILLSISDLSHADGLKIITPGQLAKTSECAKFTPNWKSWRAHDGGLEFLDEKSEATMLSPSRLSNCDVGVLPGKPPLVVAVAFMGRARSYVGGDFDCKADFNKPK